MFKFSDEAIYEIKVFLQEVRDHQHLIIPTTAILIEVAISSPDKFVYYYDDYSAPRRGSMKISEFYNLLEDNDNEI